MVVSKSYTLNFPPYQNIVTEMFGIDSGFVYEICDVEIPDEFSILYITGESGSGKTSILKEIAPHYVPESVPSTPLFLWGGNSAEQQSRTMYVLTLVGISDAILFINTYDKLSDSQKARARVALELMSDKKEIVVDEFLSTLDRRTAKPVAFCIQKAVRMLGKRLIVSTAHEDLTEFLLPDYILYGTAFPSSFRCEKNPFTHKNPFDNKIVFTYGDKADYRNLRLGELHYKGKYTGGTKEYLFAKYDNRTIGVLVSTYNRSNGGRRISRVVVHPSYRGIGVGQAIIKRYLQDFDNVDAIAAMGLINPVFEKSGMTRVENSVITPPRKLENDLRLLGLDTSLWDSPSWCFRVCQNSDVRNVVAKYANFAGSLIRPGGAKLSVQDMSIKISNDATTAGRVLFGLRKREMAKYVWKKNER